MLVTCTSTFQLDFFHYSGVGMQRIYLSYLKPSLVSCQQLWFIFSSKIGLLLTAGSKSKYLVEIVGTFILVYAICSAATVYSGTNKLLGIVGLSQLGMIEIGLVHAFALIAIVYAIAYRSGAQVNPAVTIGLLVTGKLRAKEASAVYCVPNIRGCYRCRCSIFNVWKRYGC